MKTNGSRKSRKTLPAWPRKISEGHFTVTVYRRFAPGGQPCYMVANYAGGKRRFESFAKEAEAIAEAESLAKKLAGRHFVAAEMTNAQAAEYASIVQTLEPFKVSLPLVASTVADCLQHVGGLAEMISAAKEYAVRHKRTVAKRVSDVVTELISVKEARKASVRYLQDLRSRLGRFGEAFQMDARDVTTSAIQSWFDGQKFEPQSYQNFRRVTHLLFEFAVARGYAGDNPVTGVESVKVKGGDVGIFTPAEASRLLAAASPEFLPALAIGCFAGLRSTELEKINWGDIDVTGRHIVVRWGSKTARRIVPMADNLAAWLAPYVGRSGKVWAGTHEEFYDAEAETAAATAVSADESQGIIAVKPVKWKANAMRHSYGSYRLALIGDVGRVASEMGNSPAMVHRHYKELVTPADAERWFAVKPEAPANLVPLAQGERQ